ncbi:multicopper oxidase family protein [Sporolactobacillus sp. THM19-2]|uniref:multicopper oxidase family protein n=1 Tax=Sporolactobacillus sp. THM19-2 TaxID=2511171 RepID=UPI0010211D7C|nr:multicopper oxidase [Sporolactobacillus sp. THM19-2]RYL91632.1 multicopper oxidase family protein [Sporolactobacillus sp. THM19-2]
MRLTPFIDELPVPSVLKPQWKNTHGTYYEVSMTEFRQSLHSELPDTTVWGYQGNYPGPTIEVESGETVWIKWINSLPSKHLLPIDHTVHGAHRDVPDVRTVVHVHGACVEWESDGYPEAWFTRGFAETGRFFRKEIHQYANCNPASTHWYHDHALGITRLNMYAGLVGFYLIRNSRERAMNLPSGKYDVPLMIQDKKLNADGSLYYPRQPEQPVAGLDVSIVPEFFGDTLLVNGKVHPCLRVEPRKYRFRLLNAANSRFFRLKLDSGQLMYQIATDDGLMKQPVGVTEILLSPAERADVIIDFSNLQGQKILMTNDAPVPFPDGEPVDESTGRVMQFQITLPLSHIDTSVIPARLAPFHKISERAASQVRLLTLDDATDRYGRERLLLNQRGWEAPVTETPKFGTTEIWSLINTTADSHPIHLHLVHFQILDRRDFDVEAFKKEKKIYYTGPVLPPDPQECGWKDTIRADPRQVTRIIVHFSTFTGLYVWHCHMLEHEDYEMMRPYLILR